MDDLDPIRQLQHLLDDPGKLLEKITSIQSALGSIRAPDSTGAEESAVPTSPTDQIHPTAKAPNRRYSRALQTLNEIKAQLEERLLPLGRALAQAEVEQLRERARQQRTAMNECLAQVDRRMLACLDRMHESMRRYANLTALNQRLVSLGSPAEPLPDFAPSENPIEIVQYRVDTLRRQEKI